MREIPLRGGGVALVDDEDFDRVAGVPWSSRKGYPCYGKGRITVYLHRVIMRAPAGTDVDHVNGVPHDAQKANLRFCNDSQNQANRQKVMGRVPIKGVCIHGKTGKYQAQVKKDGKNHHLGLYTDPVKAGQAYIKKARELFGEFAWSNVPEEEAA